MNLSEIENMTVVALKKELKSRNLSVTGNKGELVERLSKSINSESFEEQKGNNSDLVNVVISTDPPLLPSIAHSIVPTVTPIIPKLNSNVTMLKSETENGKIEFVADNVPNAVEESEKNLPCSEEERKLLRAKKFHTPIIQSKETRALRFGLTANTTASVPGTNQNLLKKRADRFGMNTESTCSMPATDSDQLDKFKQRALRFGVNSTNASTKVSLSSIKTSTASDETVLKRKHRFGDVALASTDKEDGSVAAKRLARAQRFGLKA